jgi:hypothetical protein
MEEGTRMPTPQQTYVPSTVDNAFAFHDEAKWQMSCGVCGRGGLFQAHHVFYRQFCERENMPLNSPDNCLRLCDRAIDGCHNRQHQGEKIPLGAIRAVTIQFGVSYIGAGKTYNYLRRMYSGADTRVEALIHV